jgi:hypothetical protein
MPRRSLLSPLLNQNLMKSLSLSMYCSLLMSLGFLLQNVPTFGQGDNGYQPRAMHSESSKELIRELQSRFEEERRGMGDDKRVRQINYERESFFIEKILDGAFVKDDSLENFVNGVLAKISESNSLNSDPKRVLILESPHVNAVCYGKGIYAVTIGLLGRIENENQLAFILSHEIAHDELGHVRKRIVREADINLEAKTQEQTIKIISGKIVQEEIDEYRQLIYGISRHNRQNEFKADSMALVLLRNANYNENEAFVTLDILKKAQSPKHNIGAELFMPLHSSNYPFQDYWLNDRLSVYSKKYMGTFLYTADSVETHPAIDLRKKALSGYVKSTAQAAVRSEQFANMVTEIAAFETVESAFRNREYDLSLYHALQLLNRHPHNAYLISRIGKIFSDLYEARGVNRFEDYVSRFTINYGDELKMINGLLYNLTQKELGEVAYHFLSNSSNFNTQEKNHYYLLWKISDLTYRNDVKENLKSAFKEKFGTGISLYSYR